jgi:hypothetical protein
MKEVVLREVPPGTPVAAAQRFMEREGFTCSLVRGGAFREERDGPLTDQPVAHEGIDFLRCERVESAGLALERRWQIAVVLRGEAVAGVLVSVRCAGP